MDSALILLQQAAAIENSRTILHKADYFNTWGLYYWFAGDFQKAINMFRKTLELPPHEHLLHSMAEAGNNAGTLYRALGKPDSARIFLEKALQIDILLDNHRGMSKTLYDLGVLHRHINQYELSLNYILKAIRILEKLDDKLMLAHAFTALGNVHHDLNSIISAIESHERALSYAMEAGNKMMVATAHNNLAAIYCQSHTGFAKASYHYDLGLPIAQEISNYSLMISFKTNMGNAWFQRNEYIKARDYFHLARSMFDQVTDPIKETDVYYRIGLSYRKTGQIDSARLYLNHSLEIAKRIQSLKDQTNALLELSKIDSISGEMHDAMANYQLGITLRDSMWNIQHRSRIAELQIIHETEKSEIRISELQQLNTKNQIVILLMGIAAILLVAAMFFVALFMRKRRLATQQQLIIQHQQTEFMKRDRDAKRRELTEKAHTLVMVNDLVQKLESKLNQMLAKADDKTAEALHEVLKIVKSLDRNEDVWNEFLSRFDELNNEFIIRLTEKYPDLTNVEKRICAMLKLDLSNKEIADITKRSVRTIEFYRGNIRKKMALGTTENIVTALSNI